MPTEPTHRTVLERPQSSPQATPPALIGLPAPRTPMAFIGTLVRRLRVGLDSRELRMALIAVNALLAAGCWLTHRAAAARERGYSTQLQTLFRMQEDAARIRTLSAAPVRAVEQRRSSADLLAQIESALNASGIPLERWQDSLPQPGQRVNDSPYTRHTTRLFIEDIPLRQLTAFAHALIAADPALSVSALRLTASGGEMDDAWNADLAISYLTTE